ncbi:MAG: tellurite resistance TerB family protein [Betaproteobacteria bacterium]|nr:MAG: tellurite resistance TerB family protein [Betaproteobacteria bacterium]
MSFGNIIGQILQQGMASQSRSRLEHTLGPSGLGGAGGLGDLLGAVLGAGGGAAAGSGGGLSDLLGGALGGQGRGGAGSAMGGGLGDLLGGVLGGASRGGNMGGGASGGLGDLLGGLLGGAGGRSSGNPLGGTGMALLATLAMAALKNWQDSRGAAAGLTDAAMSMQPDQLAAMTAPATEELVLRAMTPAAKADGQVDEDEIQRIVGKIGDNGVTPEEKQFIVEELRQPLDLRTLIDAVPNDAVAAQVYGASLLAINVDTDAEVAYLQRLAQGLGLDAATVDRLHQLTGAPVG